VRLRVRRYEPGVSGQRWDSFEVPLADRGTVLDALFYVLREHDRTLSFRFACRAAMCGSCAMRVNGDERLACKTPLAGLAAPVRVEPLRHLPVVKDLVVEMEPFFARQDAAAARFRADAARPEPATILPTDSLRQQIDAGLDCISCGACVSACPMVAADPDYLGPAALLRTFNLLADEREDPAAAGLRGEAFGRHGIWRCHGIQECTRVCPKNLDPARAIRGLKRRAMSGRFE
jgi:succinate dehydrogenase/fumarate reductase iron-sulfur protein